MWAHDGHDELRVDVCSDVGKLDWRKLRSGTAS
jgi:hypothetical protein